MAASGDQPAPATASDGDPHVTAQGDAFPVSFSQERLWFLDRLEPDNPFYNVPLIYRLDGPLDVPALASSLNEIVRRHESLRTTFPMFDGGPVQVVADEFKLDVAREDLGALDHKARQGRARELISAEVKRPFELSRGPLIRATLLRLGGHEHVLVVVIHHIVTDGWSMDVFCRELSVLYEALSQGLSPSLPALPIQYIDYSVWQREWLQGAELQRQLEYWKQQLADAPAMLDLPTDRTRPKVQRHWGAHVERVLPASLGHALKDLSRQHRCTLFMTSLAAVQVLLHRYTGQTDIVVGSPVAGRNRREIEGLIGFFVNTLAMRGNLAGDPTFPELLARTRAAALDAYAHQDLSFEKLVEEMHPPRDAGRAPLFQVMFVLRDASQGRLQLAGIKTTPLAIDEQTAKFDLILSMLEANHRSEPQGQVLPFATTPLFRNDDPYPEVFSAASSAHTRPSADQSRSS